jgi:lipoprotein-anchoring transpeptidase ErfK/SrfK
LEHGKRTSEYFMLPPGPNNPVGIAWIALSKPGIGIHGTNSPNTIGRASSHGCMRLANWDASRLAEMVTKEVKVEIE